jgi:hypothetical protein
MIARRRSVAARGLFDAGLPVAIALAYCRTTTIQRRTRCSEFTPDVPVDRDDRFLLAGMIKCAMPLCETWGEVI